MIRDAVRELQSFKSIQELQKINFTAISLPEYSNDETSDKKSKI